VGFWDTEQKTYFIYKCYMRDIDALGKTVKSLKGRLETQGLPYKNIKKCRKNLEKYKKSVGPNQTGGYKGALGQMADYLAYFVEYYDVLVELDLEPITKTLNDSFGENKSNSYRAMQISSTLNASPVHSGKVVPRQKKKKVRGC